MRKLIYLNKEWLQKYSQIQEVIFKYYVFVIRGAVKNKLNPLRNP